MWGWCALSNKQCYIWKNLISSQKSEYSSIYFSYEIHMGNTNYKTLTYAHTNTERHTYTHTHFQSSHTELFAAILVFSLVSHSSSGKGSYCRRYSRRLTSVIMNISRIKSCWLITVETERLSAVAEYQIECYIAKTQRFKYIWILNESFCAIHSASTGGGKKVSSFQNPLQVDRFVTN